MPPTLISGHKFEHLLARIDNDKMKTWEQELLGKLLVITIHNKLKFDEHFM